ncbi:alginate lyase family protein [Roseiarcaceae bacterium H3SJ34-1]|uniref:heparinase II/III domain-containing protein n=1 Tax=Terripilifer ovatus TaxID=3032367 RepID=UPI003AB9A768|nr:alginate lyase family protein [Roseiarcaceae bacterium H3SJ34-1]
MLNRIQWYGARLAAMSAPEIAHRVAELSRKSRFRGEKRGWDAIEVDCGGSFTKLGDLLALLRSVPLDCGVSFDAKSYLGRKWPAARFDEAGRNAILPHTGLWRFDPVSGKAWPGAEKAGFDIEVRMTSARPDDQYRFGDVKYVWEPARLQVLHWLAVEAAHGSELAYATAMSWVRSWMDSNPPWRGIHWISGIEIALRIISVTLLIAARSEMGVSDEDGRRLNLFVMAHASWLAQFPSRYSSANNHRVAEGLGLFLAGLILPPSPQQVGFETEGRRILQQEALLQIYPDGVGAEQSPTYQAFTMELIAFGQLVARGLGKTLGRNVDDRLRAGAHFLAALQDGEGRVPAIGDDDEGRAITCTGVAEPLYVASVIQSIMGLLGEPGLSSKGPGYLREFLFHAPKAADKAMPDSAVVQVFADGGYTVVRDRAADHRYQLIFDHGPLGYLSLAAHGHADALSVWLNVDDRPVFIDAGTWLYHSGRDARRELRRSFVHNTLSFPVQSQSEPSSAFSWANKAAARLLAHSVSSDSWMLEGEHDGFVRRAGVRHVRRIERRDDGFSIQDRLVGASRPVSCEIAFLIAPHLSVDVEDKRIVVLRDENRGAVLRLTGSSELNCRVERGDFKSCRGIYSPSFGELAATSQLVFTGAIGAEGCAILCELLGSGAPRA